MRYKTRTLHSSGNGWVPHNPHFLPYFTCDVGKGILICVLAPGPSMAGSMRKTFGEPSCATHTVDVLSMVSIGGDFSHLHR